MAMRKYEASVLCARLLRMASHMSGKPALNHDARSAFSEKNVLYSNNMEGFQCASAGYLITRWQIDIPRHNMQSDHACE